jgi:hypothetical protein
MSNEESLHSAEEKTLGTEKFGRSEGRKKPDCQKTESSPKPGKNGKKRNGRKNAIPITVKPTLPPEIATEIAHGLNLKWQQCGEKWTTAEFIVRMWRVGGPAYLERRTEALLELAKKEIFSASPSESSRRIEKAE